MTDRRRKRRRRPKVVPRAATDFVRQLKIYQKKKAGFKTWKQFFDKNAPLPKIVYYEAFWKMTIIWLICTAICLKIHIIE